MAKILWLTYAWKDNEERDVDFIVQELDKTDIVIKFDRRALVPGQRLWDQISRNITDPLKCDAWGILLTAKSITSQPCMEELAYALDRALSNNGAGFPMFALLHGISAKDMPAALRIRLGINLEDSGWIEQVIAAVEKRAPMASTTEIDPWVLAFHSTPEGECLEVRPRFERISPFAVAVDLEEKLSGNVTHCEPGVANRIPSGHVVFNWIDSQTTLTDGTPAWVWGADNEASSIASYYLFFKKRPRRVWFGHQQKLTLVTFKTF